MKRELGVGLAGALLLAAAAALAQAPVPPPPAATPAIGADGYRTGVPPVLAPEAAPKGADDSLVVARFRQAYAARRQPRIAIWWNRELSDNVATQWVDDRRLQNNIGIESAGSGSQTTLTNPTGTRTERFSDGRADIRQDIHERSGAVVAGTERRRAGLSERSSWDFETGFAQAYLEAGSRLVDRATILRTIGGGRPAGDKPDVQAIESAALLGKADLLMEILMTQDARAPAGWAFRISVKDIQSGQIVMSMVSTGPRPSATPAFQATSTGFAPRAAETTAVDVVARHLAVESMDRLASLWGAAPPAPARSGAAPATNPPARASAPADSEKTFGLEPTAGPRARVINDPGVDVIRVSPLPAPGKTGN